MKLKARINLEFKEGMSLDEVEDFLTELTMKHQGKEFESKGWSIAPVGKDFLKHPES